MSRRAHQANTSLHNCRAVPAAESTGCPTYHPPQEFTNASFFHPTQTKVMKMTSVMMQKPHHRKISRPCTHWGRSLCRTLEFLFTGPSDQPARLLIDEGGQRAQEMLLSACGVKFEEVHGHEREQRRTSDGRIQTVHSSIQKTTYDPKSSPDQRKRTMAHSITQTPRLCPLGTNGRRGTPAVELARLLENAQDGMHRDGRYHQSGTSGRPRLVIRDLEILRRQCRGVVHTCGAEIEVEASIHVRPNFLREDSWRTVDSLHAPLFPNLQMLNDVAQMEATSKSDPTSSSALFALPVPTTPMIALEAHVSTT